jgi:hypothetical protein
MPIINCLFFVTLKIPIEFSAWDVLVKRIKDKVETSIQIIAVVPDNSNSKTYLFMHLNISNVVQYRIYSVDDFKL